MYGFVIFFPLSLCIWLYIGKMLIIFFPIAGHHLNAIDSKYIFPE